MTDARKPSPLASPEAWNLVADDSRVRRRVFDVPTVASGG